MRGGIFVKYHAPHAFDGKKESVCAMAKEMEKQTEKSGKDNKPKTKQEIENARLANVMELSQGMERAETVDSVKARVDGAAHVMKSEIELSKMRGASKEAIEAKENKPIHHCIDFRGD